MTVRERVLAAVGAVSDPELRRPLSELGMIRTVAVDGERAEVHIQLTVAHCPAATRIENDVHTAALSVHGIATAQVYTGVMSAQQRTELVESLRGAAKTMPFVPGSLTRVITVTSGKGGVGKSTLTANLAVALAQRGHKVGLLDADVHGFSIPGLLGLTDADGSTPQPTRLNDMMLPPVAHDVKVVSIGMFLPDDGDRSVAWRGPMLHRTLQQFLTDVYWGDLDILLLDMPPGTGDMAISVGHLLPHAEVLVVTTPQSSAADIAIRSGRVARKTGQRLLGVVQNMAGMALPDGTIVDVFGSGGGAAVAEGLSTPEQQVPLLASIPLSPTVRIDADAGAPVVLAHPDDPAAVALSALAATLATQPRCLAGRSLPLTPRVQDRL